MMHLYSIVSEICYNKCTVYTYTMYVCMYVYTVARGVGSDYDYEGGSVNVTFPANISRVMFNYAINDDNICELNETFRLTISASSLPNRVTLGDPGQTIVTIVDEDCELQKCNTDINV